MLAYRNTEKKGGKSYQERKEEESGNIVAKGWWGSEVCGGENFGKIWNESNVRLDIVATELAFEGGGLR